MALKILLLQARNPHDPAKENELASFVAKTNLKQIQFVPFDLLSSPPTLETVKKCDALMVGGSGDYYVSKENLPHFKRTLDTLREVVTIGHPTFASCFGFQLLIKALGGEIFFDEEGSEVGTYPLTLSEEGEKDELFGILPKHFYAQLGRKDRAISIPEGVVNLASSKRAPYQAIRFPNKPIWATQFHPELNKEENLGRYRLYVEAYSIHMSEREKQDAFDRFIESPHTEILISRFLNIVFGERLDLI